MQNPTLEIYIVPKKYSLKNMSFSKYEEACTPYEHFDEIRVTDDPFDSCPMKSVLLPRLKPETIEYMRSTRSIFEIIRTYARAEIRGFLVIEGIIKTGKTMVCQQLIPMIMSNEQNTKDHLYMYIDLKLLRNSNFSYFCSNWINYIRNTWCADALKGVKINFIVDGKSFGSSGCFQHHHVYLPCW